MKKAALGVLAVTAALTFGLTGAFGGAQATPGVTAKLITIGGTFPLTGAASSYTPIARGMQAFFSYTNATRGPDKKKGIGGRQIRFIVEDDGYNPVQTVAKTRKLVEQDHVLATVGALGTEPQQSVREYMNSKKVPQLWVSTGATFWGASQADFPWSLGWQPDYQAEGVLYGRRIKNQTPDAKVAVLYQNDDYGKDYIAGLEAGLGKNKSQIIATRGYQVTDPTVTSQLLDLRRSGANILVILATPTATIRTYATLPRIGWKPDQIYLNSVSATDTFMTLAVANGGAAIVNGSISTQYLKDPASPEWANDAGIKKYRAIMAKYLPSGKATDGLYLYGMAKAQSFVNLARSVGPKLTRASLMKAALNWKESDKANPFFLPGVSSSTSKGDKFPISAERLIQFNNGTWTAIGNLVDPRPTPKK